MSVKKFLKENLVLVMGIGLPILLVILFFLTSVVPKALTEPPQHELLFSVIRYDYQTASSANFDFIVQDGVLKARTGKADQQNTNRYHKKLIVYDAGAGSMREVSYDASELSSAAEGTETVIEETRNMVIDTASKAPDGYTFEGSTYSSGGLVSELFFGGYRNQGYRIVKGKAAYKIPNTFGETYYAGNVQFIGWVIKK